MKRTFKAIKNFIIIGVLLSLTPYSHPLFDSDWMKDDFANLPFIYETLHQPSHGENGLLKESQVFASGDFPSVFSSTIHTIGKLPFKPSQITAQKQKIPLVLRC